MAGKKRATQVCPNCGAIFRKGRLACPECGSDERTGWRSAEEIDYLSVDLPDPGAGPEKSPRFTLLIAALLIVLLLLWLIAGLV
ncbi:MAG: zinc ribbon domain-containing protein [Planctomycetota bacterium]